MVVKRSIGKRNNGGEEVRKGTVRNIKRNRPDLDTEGRRKYGGREELDSFLRTRSDVRVVLFGRRFLAPCNFAQCSLLDEFHQLQRHCRHTLVDHSFVRSGRSREAVQTIANDPERWEDLFVNNPWLR